METFSAGLSARIALEKHGFKPNHTLGQNFILDDDFLGHLLDISGVQSDDRVLEIGPGAGVMTRLLAERALKVLAIETDENLKPVLDDVLNGFPNAEVHFNDALKTDLSTIITSRLLQDGVGEYRVIANLPYYITADLILKMLKTDPLPYSLCIMVQKEAAERLMSHPGDKNWGALAATVNYFADCEVLEEVSPDHFSPAPHVDSCFIRLDIKPDRLLTKEEENDFLKMIRCCFQMRRKTLANNLKAGYGITQVQASAIIEEAGFAPQIRGEVLTLNELAGLYRILARQIQ